MDLAGAHQNKEAAKSPSWEGVQAMQGPGGEKPGCPSCELISTWSENREPLSPQATSWFRAQTELIATEVKKTAECLYCLMDLVGLGQWSEQGLGG